MAIVSRLELDHPPLDDPGGAPLHAQVEALYVKIGDAVSSRYFEAIAIANTATATFDHNFKMPFDELSFVVYNLAGAGGELTVADQADYAISATAGNLTTQVDVQNNSGGVSTFAVLAQSIGGSGGGDFNLASPTTNSLVIEEEANPGMTGIQNTLYGIDAGGAISSGSANVMVGFQAGLVLAGSGNNTFVGKGAGSSATIGSTNTLMGADAGNKIVDGNSNIVIGSQSDTKIDSTSNAVIIGTFTEAHSNSTVVGYSAKANDNTVAIGYSAGNTSNQRSAFVGYESGTGVGAEQSGIGYQSLKFSSGQYNVGLGARSLSAATFSGSSNVAVGRSSGNLVTTGAFNTLIGYAAGSGSGSDAAITTGSRNVCIGDTVSVAVGTDSDKLILGNSKNKLITGDFDAVTLNLHGTVTIANAAGVEQFTLPALDGAANQVLTTDGANSVTWEDPAGGGGDFNLASPTTGSLVVDEEANPGMTGFHNTLYGIDAGDSLIGGNQSVCIGSNAGTAATTGQNMTMLGYAAGNNSNASGPTSVGALSDADGNFSTAVGYAAKALLANTTAIGAEAKAAGDNSSAFGYRAGLNSGASATNNTLVGDSAGSTITTGAGNTLVGYNAGYDVGVESNIVAIGDQAGGGDGNNVSIGKFAGVTNGAANDSVAVGYSAIARNGASVAIGANVNAGTRSVSIGFDAGQGGNANDSVFIGWKAGNAQSTGQRNVIIGHNSGPVATGDSQTMIGDDAGLVTTSALGTTFVGQNSGSAHTTHSYGNAFGYNAGTAVAGKFSWCAFGSFSQANGNEATAVGHNSNADGQNSVAIGANSHTTTSGVAIGSAAGGGGSGVIIGTSAGPSTTGSGNVIIGQSAAQSLTTGFNNIIIGSFLDVAAAADSNKLLIGTSVNTLISGDIFASTLKLHGTVSITDAAGVPQFTLPAGDGALDQVLTTDGAGAVTWQAGGGGGGGDFTLENTTVGSVTLAEEVGAMTGTQNTLYGVDAGDSITTANGNTHIGYQAGTAAVSGVYGTSLGYIAGSASTYFGWVALGSFTVVGGNETVAVGHQANANALQAVSVGYQAKSNANGVSVGNQAGLISTGGNNTFLGDTAGVAVTSGAGNTFLGYNAGYDVVTESGNVSIGEQAGGGDGNNVVIGKFANAASGAANNSVAIGYLAIARNGDSIAIGDRAVAGTKSVAIGALTGQGAGATNNVMIGFEAGSVVNTGTANTFIGYQSGKNATGDGNTFLGNSTGTIAAFTGSNNICIGRGQGPGASDSGKFLLGNTSISSIPLLSGLMSATVPNLQLNGTFTIATAGGVAEYTLPAADGTAGQRLQTDGAGNLSWVTP